MSQLETHQEELTPGLESLTQSSCSDCPRRSDQYPYHCSPRGVIYYTPRSNGDRRTRPATAAATNPPSLPTPRIGPRQRRPHSIHIVSYPTGFVPHELRPKPIERQRKEEERQRKKEEERQKKQTIQNNKRRKAREQERKRALASLSGNGKTSTIFERLKAAFSSNGQHQQQPSSSGDSTPTPVPQPRARTRVRPVSWLSITSRLSRTEETIHDEAPALPTLPRPSSTNVNMALRPPLLTSGQNAVSGHSHRNSIMSVRSAKSIMSSSVQEIQQKPVASGSGLSCSILLAEPNVFLTGFDHDGHTRHESHNSTALLRGKLQLNVSKNTKVKSITLKLLGKARTEWPEGIPPLKVDMFEEESLRTQALTFFHAMHDGWETEYGNQCTYMLKGSLSGINPHRLSLSPNDSVTSLQLASRPRSNMTAKELKRLSLRSVESRSFGKGESPSANHVQAKGFKVFYPGTYEYSFELPIDHHQLETTKLQYGSVKWELETTVERAGAFKPNLHGTREVSIVRVPDQLSLEMSEPISISRRWEDQLHYDIMISGKSFPIGTKIPIAFKLTPLAKVQVHKIKVFVTESIEYWTNDRKVTRKDPGRKILLLEKTAGKPLDKQYESSELRVVSGGELSPDERRYAREAASRRRTMEAQRSNIAPQPLPEPTDNLLGDLDLGLESYWGSTEIEMNVQIPTCEMMAKDKSIRLHPDCSWKNVNVYHWIKLVMRISRADPEDPTGKRRRHFEISIDSPFTVLNCRATQANTALPQYNNPDSPSIYHQRSSCGCPDAQIIATNASPGSSNGNLHLVETSPINAALPMPPQAAYLPSATQGVSGHCRTSGPVTGGSSAANPLQRVRDQDGAARPIHLLRYPSFDPPPFNADESPPPPPPETPPEAMTPPPNYDVIIGTPSVDGLADYFARLSRYEDPETGQILPCPPNNGGSFFASGAGGPSRATGADGIADAMSPEDEGEDTEVEEDSDSADERAPARAVSRTGTVNIANPRTPGGRLVPSRSFEINRPPVNFTLSMAGVVRRDTTAA